MRDHRGDPISLFDVNMFHIAEHIIRPAIEFEEERRGTRQKYSWVEFVAEDDQQTPDIMFSHSWTGRFQDFMAAANKLEESRGFGGRANIWICTFANSQFGEDFGTGLQDSPFSKAVHRAKELVLVVDRDASSLQRIWCGLELHMTMRTKKPLAIFTSMGQVGVSVTSGPLVEAIEAWDVTRMEASQDTDRRQILNYLCGGEQQEKSGLKTDSAGNFVLSEGWRKQLEDGGEVAVGAPRRLSGQHEYEHEARLFRDHAETFSRLSAAVRGAVLQAAHAGPGGGPDKGPSPIPCIAHRGVTLGELRTVVKKAKALASARGDRVWEDLTVCQFATKFVSASNPEGFSYAEVVSPGPRTPQYVIDEVFESGIQHALSSIEWAAEALKLKDCAVLFFAPLCIDLRRCKAETMTWDKDIETLIKDSYGWITLLPCTREGIVRSKRMHQLAFCFKHARPIYFACPCGVLAGLKPFRDSSWEFGRFDPAIARVLLDADWEAAQCVNQELEVNARLQVRSLPGGLASFRARLASAAAGPVLRHAVLDPSPAGLVAVEALCRRRGLRVNSQLFRGPLGETPLHIAAAVGNTRAVEALLAAKADPNAEDHILETPLHYAAMGGCASSTRILLMHGAITEVESAFAESPMLLAKQNPAAFLGHNTGKVIALLEAWGAAQGEDGA